MVEKFLDLPKYFVHAAGLGDQRFCKTFISCNTISIDIDLFINNKCTQNLFTQYTIIQYVKKCDRIET